MKSFKEFCEQVYPGRTYIPKALDQIHVMPRSAAELAKKVKDKVNYYGGMPPKGPK